MGNGNLPTLGECRNKVSACPRRPPRLSGELFLLGKFTAETRRTRRLRRGKPLFRQAPLATWGSPNLIRIMIEELTPERNPRVNGFWTGSRGEGLATPPSFPSQPEGMKTSRTATSTVAEEEPPVDHPIVCRPFPKAFP
jgi:hypothetical protein